MSAIHPASRLALLQILVIFIGLCTTTLSLKFNREILEASVDWNIWALAVRGGGLLLLVIPLLWVILSLRMENREDNQWTTRWTIVTGVLVLVGLSSFLIWTTLYPYFGTCHMMTMGTQE